MAVLRRPLPPRPRAGRRRARRRWAPRDLTPARRVSASAALLTSTRNSSVDPIGRRTWRCAFRAIEFLTRSRVSGWRDRPPVADGSSRRPWTSPPRRPTAIVHGDFHLRHLLVGETGEPTAVIDWIDLSRNDSCVDLVLYWSVLPARDARSSSRAMGRSPRINSSEAVSWRSFSAPVLAVYGQDSGIEALRREAVAVSTARGAEPLLCRQRRPMPRSRTASLSGSGSPAAMAALGLAVGAPLPAVALAPVLRRSRRWCPVHGGPDCRFRSG